jgi:hypothetical protein
VSASSACEQAIRATATPAAANVAPLRPGLHIAAAKN